MRRRRVSLIAAKWAFTGVATAVVVANVASHWWLAGWKQGAASGGSTEVWIVKGAVWIQHVDGDLTGQKGFYGHPTRDWKMVLYSAAGTRVPVAWRYGVYSDRPRLFAVTMLYPFTVVAIPAALLWWIDVRARRRERAGRCENCGYDRRGLAADAKCPECGTVPAPASK